MNDRTGIWAGLAGIGLLVICCGGPLLIGAIGVLSASALLGWATHIVLPAAGLLVVVLAFAFYLRSRRGHARDCCDDGSATPPRNVR